MSTTTEGWVGVNSNVPPKRTSEQPWRGVASVGRFGLGSIALLTCGHEEPITGREHWSQIRCQQCDPVRRDRTPPVPTPNPDDLLEP